ncbi:MAG: type II secretion system ATPase GspE [Desulfobacteraceae bacterium]|nr:type II secretion system ATPase GspE [Desulfobacteraceae bacterium]
MKNILPDILEQNFGVPRTVFTESQRIQREKGGSIGDLLIQKKAITESQLLEAYSLLYEIPFWPELPIDKVSVDLTQKVSIQFLKKFFMVPLALDAEKVTTHHPGPLNGPDAEPEKINIQSTVIAVNDPSAFQPLDDLIRLLGIEEYQLVLSTRNAILSVINLSYDLGQNSAEQLVQDMEDSDESLISEIEDTADLLDDTSDAPIIKLVNNIISQSIKARASDIHFEPYQDSFKVRYRIDGILYDLLTPPKWIQPALTSRIKVMAKLNIAEKRLPQDGRFEVKIGNQVIDVRVSTLPISYGERVVLRLLVKSGSVLMMTDLGFSPKMLSQMTELVKSPNGIILVTGPTGSGKTTTLYSILSSINTPDINIITVEDPVEYQLKGISQIQVNPKIELTFARGLRSIVRQDPDVILIGEIRDKETAEIAVQSALTGHLVFSTIHTNDSASAITRLVDMGVEPFLISSSVIAIVAQRLVRVLCNDCKKVYNPGSSAQNLGFKIENIDSYRFYTPVGCDSCFNTGYRGRIGIFELMIMGPSLKELIIKTHDSVRIKHEALNEGMVMLRNDGLDKVLKGITSIEEVIRVTQK